MLPKKAPIVDNPVIESLDNMEASYKINREKGFLDCYLLSSQITQLIDLINSDNQLTEYEVIENVSFKNDTIIVPYCGMKKDSSLSISTVLADSEKTWNEDYYYFLGDNREKSIDSRNWGPIPSSRIIKIANKIVFSIDDGQIRWTRIKKTI